MERIGEEVRRELDRFGPAGAAGEVAASWPALVGDAIATNAWPARVGADGTLHVTTADSVWAFELGQQAPEILARLQRELGDRAPKALRFRAGLLPELGPEAPEEVPPPRVVPSAEELREGEELAAPIEDPELRERVARAAAASLARAAADRGF